MVEVKVKGIEKLIAKKYSRNLIRGIKSGIGKSLIFMHGVGVKSTPIHTGILRKGFRERQSGLKGKMFNKVKYAKFVNEGTRFQKANPFLKNIRNLSENKIDTILNNEIEKVIG